MNQAEIKRRQAEEIANILTLVTVFIMGNLMADGGTTYMAAALVSCFLVGLAISGSLSDTLGKLLRSRRNKGQYKNIPKMRRTILLFQSALGLAGTLLLILSAGAVAEGIFRIPYSTFILMALSPVIVLRTVSGVLQGYFQGEGAELPRAVAGIGRQILILVFGCIFCKMFCRYGEKVSALLMKPEFTPMYGCMGIALAVSLAEIVIILFLTVLFRISRRGERAAKQEGMYTESAWDCIKSLCAGRWPMFAVQLMPALALFSGLMLFCRAAANGEGNASSYDIYMGKYLVICGVPVCLISMLVFPVMGRIFQSFRKEESRFARTAFQAGVHLTMIHGIFFSVYTAFMGPQIAGLLGGDAGESVKKMLQGGSFFILFAALSLYFSRFLQVMGKKYLVLGAGGIALAVFVVTIIAASKKGIISLVYGGLTAALVLCVLLAVLSYRILRVRLDWLSVLILPAGAGGISGLLSMLLGNLMTSGLGNLMTLLICAAVSGAVYWGLLLVLRDFREAELDMFPGGRLLSLLGQMMHIY